MLSKIDEGKADSPVLTLRGISKRFGNIRVLNGVNAEIARGKVTAFIGPNGAGKTTLFHSVSGDLGIDSGTVEFEGRTINGSPPWRIARMGLGKQFQDVRVFGALTCEENILLALADHGSQSPVTSLLLAYRNRYRVDDSRDRARNFLSMVGLESKALDPAETLSFGNQKLLAFARLLAGDFPLLLLDEPSSGVSPTTIAKIVCILQDAARKEGRTVILIEHNMSFVSELADITYVLKDGIVVDSGPTLEVLGRPQNRELCLGI